MSDIKIQPSATGSGTVTITAPTTNTARVITLPDSAGTLLDENSSVPAANLTGTVADARFPATLPAASGVNLTALPAGNLTGTVADARISALTASKLTGALPAISGASLTGLTSSQMPTGSVVQVKQTLKTDTQSFATTWGFTQISGLTVNITPTLSNSTFVITASIVCSSSYYSYGFLIYKDGADIGVKGDTNSTNTRVAFGGNVMDGNGGNEDHEVNTDAYTYLYQSTAPAGTSVAFDIYAGHYSASHPFHINRPADGSTSSSRIRGTSTLTVMEIAG